jgi:hypothetical protein
MIAPSCLPHLFSSFYFLFFVLEFSLFLIFGLLGGTCSSFCYYQYYQVVHGNCFFDLFSLRKHCIRRITFWPKKKLDEFCLGITYACSFLSQPTHLIDLFWKEVLHPGPKETCPEERLFVNLPKKKFLDKKKTFEKLYFFRQPQAEKTHPWKMT